jgi:phosphate:Na+ symporter
MAASFAERGLVATVPAFAVMLGADVGTSLVAQALSLRIEWLWPLLVIVGFVAFSTGGSSRRRDLGRAVVGLGLMLLALRLIVDASDPIRQSAVLETVLRALQSEPILAVVLAALLTWLAHSSLAVVLLIQSFATVGMVPMALALALVLGANLGGAFPAVAATWNGDAGARRITLGNAFFRASGVVAGLALLPIVAPWIAAFDPDPGRLAVNAHLLFNMVLAVAFLPLLTPIAILADRWLPAKVADDDPTRPRYLDPNAIDSPALALAAAARESLRMGDTLESMLRDTLTVFRNDDRKLADDICKRDDVVDRLHEAIKLYLTQVSREALGDADSRRSMEIIAYTTNMEHVGDIIDKNLMELAIKKIRNRLSFSDEGFAEIVELHTEVLNTLKLSLAVFMGGDLASARRLLEEKVRFREREMRAAERHLERLKGGRIQSIETSSLHLDILRDLKRINSHLISVAYPILEQAGELRASRLATT